MISRQECKHPKIKIKPKRFVRDVRGEEKEQNISTVKKVKIIDLWISNSFTDWEKLNLV